MTYTTKASWNFCNPTEIHFGVKLPSELKRFILPVPTLFVTSPGFVKRGMAKLFTNELEAAGIDFKLLGIGTPNPSFDDLSHVHGVLDGYRPRQILAVGGGSVLDLAKVLSYTLSPELPGGFDLYAALLSNEALPAALPVPMIAVPTTSGTGSEVTPFATVWDMNAKKKYSLATPNLFPKKALLDPTLTETLPWDVTLSTSIDAIAQALESVWNHNYTPITGALAARSLRLGLEALVALSKNLGDLSARVKMAESSLLAGLCISRTRTAMSHSISYPLTAHYGVPHGIACGFTLPDLWSQNLKVDDGRMAQLQKDLGFGVSFDFTAHLHAVMTDVGYAEEFKKQNLVWDNVKQAIPEMYTTGRAGNNLFDFSEPHSIDEFVKKSFHRWS
jgi:alcohol dehydrogenase